MQALTDGQGFLLTMRILRFLRTPNGILLLAILAIFLIPYLPQLWNGVLSCLPSG